MKAARIFRHPRHDEIFVGVIRGHERDAELRVCSMTEGVVGSFDINDVDRLCAVYDHAHTRAQGVADLAEFFESVCSVSYREGLIVGDIFAMCVEAIATEFVPSTLL